MLSRRGYSHTRYAKARVVRAASTAMLLTTGRKKASLAPLTTPFIFSAANEACRRSHRHPSIRWSHGRWIWLRPPTERQGSLVPSPLCPPKQRQTKYGVVPQGNNREVTTIDSARRKRAHTANCGTLTPGATNSEAFFSPPPTMEAGFALGVSGRL